MDYARLLTRVRPVELAEFLKKLSGLSYREVAIDGRRWYVDPASNFGQRLISEGSYEREATDALLGLLRPGDTFLDVGANEGWFSVRAAERVGPAGFVAAVEPQARLWPVIARNFALNGLHHYVLVPYAAGAAEGTTEILLYPSLNTGASSLVREARTRARARQTIGVLPLDRICRIHRLTTIRLAKIDIEGFELEALKGAGDLLGRIEHLFIELHPSQLRALGQSVDDVERLLVSRGYAPQQVGGVDVWSLASVREGTLTGAQTDAQLT